MFCTKCGTEIADDGKFCTNCGAKTAKAVKTSGNRPGINVAELLKAALASAQTAVTLGQKVVIVLCALLLLSMSLGWMKFEGWMELTTRTDHYRLSAHDSISMFGMFSQVSRAHKNIRPMRADNDARISFLYWRSSGNFTNSQMYNGWADSGAIAIAVIILSVCRVLLGIAAIFCPISLILSVYLLVTGKGGARLFTALATIPVALVAFVYIAVVIFLREIATDFNLVPSGFRTAPWLYVSLVLCVAVFTAVFITAPRARRTGRHG
jgi:hypothetical protein